MKIRYLILVLPALVVLPQIGCSSTASSTDSSDCLKNPITPTCRALDYTKLDATAVSFKTDIFGPIIRPTCNSVACHGSKTKNDTYPGAGLYLGPLASDSATPIDDALLATINGELLAASTTASSMKIVAPSDPANSFLMLKLTGCENTKSLTCTVQSMMASETKAGCGDPMPPSCFAKTDSLTLTDVQIATFARWIAQGAKNN